MVTLRCTKKLLARLPVSPAPGPPTTVLGDWYADLLVVRPRWLVLCVNERSLLSVLVPAREFATLPARFRVAIGHRLRRLGVTEEAVTRELVAMETVSIGPTASRRIVGTLVDLRFQVSWMLGRDGTENLDRIAEDLGEVPCTAAPGHFPSNAARDLFRTATATSRG